MAKGTNRDTEYEKGRVFYTVFFASGQCGRYDIFGNLCGLGYEGESIKEQMLESTT